MAELHVQEQMLMIVIKRKVGRRLPMHACMRLCFTAIDDAFAYDNDTYHACVLFCFIKSCYNMYNLTK